jgi:hypothetical protein
MRSKNGIATHLVECREKALHLHVVGDKRECANT